MTATLGHQVRSLGGLAVTISGPRGEAEVTLPDDLALGQLLGALSLTYAGARATEVVVVVRPGGALDPSKTLAESGIEPGAVLNLFPLDRLPAAWHATEPAPALAPHQGTLALHPQRRPQPAPRRTGSCGWIGAHGGAGTSTLAAAFAGPDLGTYTPAATPVASGSLLVVARAHAAGLLAAQHFAAAELADGTRPLAGSVAGLVIVADAPGRAPKALRDLARLVSGGFPRHALVPWVESWRLGEETESHLPRSLRSLVASVSSTRRLV